MREALIPRSLVVAAQAVSGLSLWRHSHHQRDHWFLQESPCFFMRNTHYLMISQRGVGASGLEPLKPKQKIYSLPELPLSDTPNFALQDGIEPPTS